MSNGNIALGSINKFLQFQAGLQRGREKQRKKQQDELMRKLILELAQKGHMDATIKMDANGEISYSLKPGKTPTAAETAKNTGRFAFNLPGATTPSTETMLPVMPKVTPRAGGGYVGPSPGRPGWQEGSKNLV